VVILIKKNVALLLIFCILLFSSGVKAGAEGVGSLSSVSAVLFEPESGRVLYEKDAHTPRPMASTTKIMTALLAIERCAPDKVITVSAEAVRVEGSALGLRGGDQITMIDLVTGLLLESGNDAANVIAYAVSGGIPNFAKLMNERAAEIGMVDTEFVTPSGLDQGNHSSSAYDMALLAAEALGNETVAKICATESALISFGNPPRKIRVTNHNRLLKLYPYAIGMKTGFTKKSGRCLVSAAEKDGVKLVAVTLKAGDDWNDHIAMYDYGFSETESVTLPPQSLHALPVSGGTADQVGLNMETPPACTLLKDEIESLRVELCLPRFVLAPVTAGEIVGTVKYYAGDRELCTLTVTATESVSARPVAGFGKRFFRSLSELIREWLRV
jgi:D-alanyl-D-alanine carboxypeptidase/D-alanyl-D-alanine carboxypeptidase (penicillin-binding protein 5/6)